MVSLSESIASIREGLGLLKSISGGKSRNEIAEAIAKYEPVLEFQEKLKTEVDVLDFWKRVHHALQFLFVVQFPSFTYGAKLGRGGLAAQLGDDAPPYKDNRPLRYWIKFEYDNACDAFGCISGIKDLRNVIGTSSETKRELLDRFENRWLDPINDYIDGASLIVKDHIKLSEEDLRDYENAHRSAFKKLSALFKHSDDEIRKKVEDLTKI